MSGLPVKARIYILAVTTLAFCLGAFLLSNTTFPTGRQLALAVTILVLMALVGSLQIRLDKDTTLSLDFNLIFAAAFLFSPGITMLIVAVAVLPNSLVRRISFPKTLFNTASLVIVGGITSLILHLSGSSSLSERLTSLSEMGIILLAVVVMFVTNTILVTGIISLVTGRSWLDYYRDIGTVNLVAYGVDIGLGLIATGLAQVAPWALIAVAVPLWGVYSLVQSQVRLRENLERALKASEEHLAEANRMTHRAYHDSLTGLPNRALLYDRMEVAVERSRSTHQTLAVMFMDLDGFKQVNDSFGHETGDLLLQKVAERLVEDVRPHDTVARIGGDEFALLLDDVDEHDAKSIATRIVEAVRKPYNVHGICVEIGISVGIAVSNDNSYTLEEFMNWADKAMYEAKSSGKGRFKLHTERPSLSSAGSTDGGL